MGLSVQITSRRPADLQTVIGKGSFIRIGLWSSSESHAAAEVQI